MEMLNDIHDEKLMDQRKKLNDFTSNLWKSQIKQANDKYLDEKHMEILNTVGKNYSFEETLIVREVFEFLKK